MRRSLLLPLVLVSLACGDPAAKADTPTKAAPPEAKQADEDTSPAPTPKPNAFCDTTALTTVAEDIATRTAAWSPKTGTLPDFSFEAISALWIHCPKLPDEAKRLLHSLVDHERMPSKADIAAAQGRPAPAVNDDPIDAKLPGHARFHGMLDEKTAEAGWAWRAPLLCPDYPEIAKSVSRMGSDERRVAVWDRCVHHFEFVTRDEYLRSRMESGKMGFAMHRWLSDAGVDKSVADAFGRALTLGGHWMLVSPFKYELPAAEVDTRLDGMPLVEVRPGVIRCGGRTVARIDATLGLEGLESADGVEFLPYLQDIAAEELVRSKPAGAEDSPPPDGLMVVHRSLTWATLGPVVASVYRAGYQRISVIVLADDRVDPLRSAVIHDATVADPPLAVAPTTTVQALVDTIVARPGPVRLFAAPGGS